VTATRPAITGLGVVAPTGTTTEAYWTATLAGENGIGVATLFDADSYPSRLSGEIKGFNPADHLSMRLLPSTDRMTQLAMVASDRALEDAGIDLETVPEERRGTLTAASAGGYEFGQRELQNLWSRGSKYVSAYQSYAWFYAVNTGQLSIRHGLKGHSGVVVSDGAGGLDSLGAARRRIARGNTLMLTGAVDSSLCPWGWVAQMAPGWMSTEDDPAQAYLPFDARAGGHVGGEGGAILVLEAEPRPGKDVYGYLAGHASTMDGAGETPGGGMGRAIGLALQDAGIAGGEVDVVFADGAGTRAADQAEAAAIESVFGPAGVPVTVPKAATGRLYSAAGALDVATALLAMRDGVIPPTINSSPDESLRIDLVTEPREATVRSALILARGYGGFNAALVVTRSPNTSE
jgi:act minimal PKS chain-length factor (CLF/KS beta)